MFVYTLIMIHTYRELLKIYGNQRQVANAVKAGKYFLISRGIYSDEFHQVTPEYIAKRYPSVIFTGQTAFYHYGYSTDAGSTYDIASKLGATRIKHPMIHQSFQVPSIFEVGRTQINGMNFYDKERMLIELIRGKSSFSYDYYKEVLDGFRKDIHHIDLYKVSQYVKRFKNGKNLLKKIREAL